MPIELREITRDNLNAVLALAVAPEQRGFVASNERSLAQAHFYPEMAWFRAIYADGEPVGFVMLALEPDKAPFVWRLMVDQRHQGRGVGRESLRLVMEHLRQTRPDATELKLSHGQGAGSPGPFYERLGFEYTGEVEDDELVMRIGLGD